MPPCVANPVLPQRSHRPAVQGDKGVGTQPLPLKGDHPIGEASSSLPHCQESCPLGLTRPPGGPTNDHATAL